MDTNAKLYQDMTKILVKREDIQKAVAQLGTLHAVLDGLIYQMR